MKWCHAAATVLLLSICFVQNLRAHEGAGWSERFAPHELNYGILQSTGGDDIATEVQYSLKFLVFDYPKRGAQGNQSRSRPDRFSKYSLFLSYTGQFDFYMGTRESGPVINRISNPAVHLKYDRARSDSSSGWWLGVAFEHRSNGQATDASERDDDTLSPTYGKYLAEIEYEKGNHEYFDYISRGANYFTLSYGWRHKNIGSAELSYKVYLEDSEDYITWGEFAGTDTSFSDFDLVRLKLQSMVFVDPFSHMEIVVGGVVTIGNELFDTSSYSYDLYGIFTFRPWELALPVFVKAHFGPMDRLSDYSTSYTSYGAGLGLHY